MRRSKMAVMFLTALFLSILFGSVIKRRCIKPIETPYTFDTKMSEKSYIGFDSVSSNLLIGLRPLPEQTESMLVEFREYGKLIYAQRRDGTWVDNRMPPKGFLE